MSFNGSPETATISAYAPSATAPSSPFISSISAEMKGELGAEFSFHFQHLGGARRRRLDGRHRGHAERHHAPKFLGDGFRPRNAAHVRAENNFEASLDCLPERRFVHARAGAVALSRRRVFRSPVVVIRRDRWAVPGTLARHLRDVGVGQLKAVFDRVAAAIERALKAERCVMYTLIQSAP